VSAPKQLRWLQAGIIATSPLTAPKPTPSRLEDRAAPSKQLHTSALIEEASCSAEQKVNTSDFGRVSLCEKLEIRSHLFVISVHAWSLGQV
jgi:hypothetical protein